MTDAAHGVEWPQPIYVLAEEGGAELSLRRVAQSWKRVDVVPAQSAVVLDDDILANLDKRAERQNTDRAGYLRWVLTGKEPKK